MNPNESSEESFDDLAQPKTGQENTQINNEFNTILRDAQDKLKSNKLLELESFIFQNFEVLNKNFNYLTQYTKLFKIFEKISYEKTFQEKVASHKDKLSQIGMSTYTPPAEDAQYIAAQTGGDPTRTELYTQASFVMRAQPAELEKAGIKKEDVAKLQTAAESLGFRKSFSAETFVTQDKGLAGFSQEKTTQAQELVRSSVPDGKLASTTITREGSKLTYSDATNPKYSYQIDMSDTPPRLSKSMNGLSIEIQRGQENPERKKAEEILTSKKVETQNLGNEINSSFGSIIIGTKFDINNLSDDELQLLKESPEIDKILRDMNAPVKDYNERITELEQKKSSVGVKASVIDRFAIDLAISFYRFGNDLRNIGGESTTLSADQSINKGTIERLLFLKNGGKIEKYIQLRKDEDKARENLKGIKSPSLGQQNEAVNFNLDFLANNGFHELRQENLEKLFAALNEKYKGRLEPFSMNSAARFDNAQQKILSDLTNQLREHFMKIKSDNPPTSNNLLWQGIAQGLRVNESFRNVWNSTTGLNIWIQKQIGPNKETRTPETLK